MVVLGLTNCFLIGYETCSAEKKKFMPGIANLVRKIYVAGGGGVSDLK